MIKTELGLIHILMLYCIHINNKTEMLIDNLLLINLNYCFVNLREFNVSEKQEKLKDFTLLSLMHSIHQSNSKLQQMVPVSVWNIIRFPFLSSVKILK